MYRMVKGIKLLYTHIRLFSIGTKVAYIYVVTLGGSLWISTSCRNFLQPKISTHTHTVSLGEKVTRSYHVGTTG